MNEDQLWMFCSLGINEKRPGLDAGTHGIGTYAGATIGTKLEVWTQKIGANKAYKGEIDFQLIFTNESKQGTSAYISSAEELVSRAVSVFEDEAVYRPDLHFTHVKITLKAKPEIIFRQKSSTLPKRVHRTGSPTAGDYREALKEFLGMYCPVDFPPDMSHAFINQIKAGMPLVKALRKPIQLFIDTEPVFKHNPEQEITGVSIHTIRAKGSSKPLAQIWFGLHKKLQAIKKPWLRGIVMYQEGFGVDTSERKFVASEFFSRLDIGFYFTGEIHLLDESLVPNMERTWMQRDGAWENTANALREFFKPYDRSVFDRSDAQNTAEKLEALVDEGLVLIGKVNTPSPSTFALAKLMRWQDKAKDSIKPRSLKLLPVGQQVGYQSLLDRVTAIVDDTEDGEGTQAPEPRNAPGLQPTEPLSISPFRDSTPANSPGPTSVSGGGQWGVVREASNTPAPDSMYSTEDESQGVEAPPGAVQLGVPTAGSAALRSTAAEAATDVVNGVPVHALKALLLVALDRARTEPGLALDELAAEFMENLRGRTV